MPALSVILCLRYPNPSILIRLIPKGTSRFAGSAVYLNDFCMWHFDVPLT